VSSSIEPSKPVIVQSSTSAASEPSPDISPTHSRPASAPNNFPSLIALEESDPDESGKSLLDFLSTATAAPTPSTTWKPNWRGIWYQLSSFIGRKKKKENE
jgi:hypothetical protein